LLLFASLLSFRRHHEPQSMCQKEDLSLALQQDKTLEEDFCSACEKTIGLSASYLAINMDLWKGVCHRLNGSTNDGVNAFAPTSNSSTSSRSKQSIFQDN
jgi:hypothetical protein